MKIFSVLCILLVAALCACQTRGDARIPIAILTPLTHPSLEQCAKGFIDTMEQASPGRYRFVTYNAQGNKTLMHSEVEEIARKNYALVFSLGTSSASMTKELFAKKGLRTPIVFTCVNDPLEYHLIASESAPGGTVTGVKELLDLEAEIDSLLRYKPFIEKVLLVYNPMEAGLQKDQREVARLLRQKNIDLVTLEVFLANEIRSKAAPFMDQVDALLVLKDNTVVSGLDALIKLCEQQRIPLMASDLDSPDRGAAFGYGVHEIEFGIEAAKKALQILEEQICPAVIPVTPVSRFTLKINPEAAQRQGIDKEVLCSLQS